ncbi:MAG: CHAT domain-containing protein [Saprospiraceae bacterium]|nr:CHAT domain-containing protein [Saprospiraceae bacterium]
MKHFIIYFLLFAPCLCTAQAIDSSIINQIDSLLKVSQDFTDRREFEKALEINAIAEKITLDKLGRESAEYVSCCNNRGTINYYKRDDKEAEKWYLESKNIGEKVLGNEHPDHAHSFNNLANLYADLGDYSKAEIMHLEASKIREKAYGKDHPEYAYSLNNLANLYFDIGNYENAEKLHIQAKSIREKALGKEHPDYAASLNNLATLYFEMGEYEKAEPYFLESKAVREKALGKEHPNYAASLNNLAGFYSKLGNFKKAEPLFLESKSIREKIFGNEHPKYAISLLNLANLYADIGLYEKAKPLLLESLAIWEKAVGKEHPNYIICLISLADLYFETGNYENARTSYYQSNSILKSTLGSLHPLYIGSVFKLAEWNNKMGNYYLADSLYLESKLLTEQVLGKEHPSYSSCLNNIAVLYENRKMFEDSEKFLVELSSLEQKRISKASSFLSEIELMNYTATFQKRINNLGSYILARNLTETKTGKLNEIFFDNALFFKGFLLNSILRQDNLANISPKSQEINNQLKSYQRILVAEYAKPLDQRKRISELEEKVTTTQKELAHLVTGYAGIIRQLNWQELKIKLKLNEVAIEFIHFQISFPNKSDSIMYAALLLKPDESQPIFISLFEEKSLDSLLQLNAERKTDYVNNLYSIAGRGAVALETPKRTLYEMIWEPIEKYMEGIKTIYFSPSGLLHRINLDAIPVSESETLADKYRLIELNSTRQLVIPDQVEIMNNDAVLYGGIQFEADTTFHKNEPVIASRSRGELSFSSVDSSLRGGSWSYLPGTAREINSIESILKKSKVKITLKTGYGATEESFKNLGANNTSSPRILHIATHGYFFEDLIKSSQKSEINSQNENVFKMSDHPMLRSGLIMAGGNATWQGKQTIEGREDGILTAYEISQMNLSNTELVVLSACETGLGDIQGNEGVYGLQRAFKIAGAKYLIMSLWQVPDKQTSLLMTTFYKKWLNAESPDNGGKKMTIPDAFHAAQKELREIGLDPYQWAGFVLVE